MDSYLISLVPPDAVDVFASRVESMGASFLGPQYLPKVRAVVPGARLHTVVTVARNQHNPMPELWAENDSLLALFSGYVVDDITDAKAIRRYFRRHTTDERPILVSPGGIYSYATVRRSDGQVCAGHSTPTLEPVFYSESLNALHIGTHPLLVHAAARDFQQPELNELFFFSAVGAGVALDNMTPFVGCYRVPPRTILLTKVSALGIHIRAAPRPDHGRFRITTYRQRVDSMTEALLQAGSILQRIPRGEVRLSGGKDSRLVAASIKAAGTDVVPVNQNIPEEVEGQVADMVARELGFSSCRRLRIEESVDRDDIPGGTRRKIAYASGLPAGASFHYPFRTEGTSPGVPLIMGHAHLQRGGFPNRIKSIPEALFVAESRTVSQFLRPAFAEATSRLVRHFVIETLERNHYMVQAVGFFAYLEYPMNYQFQSLYAYVRNWNPLVTPLVDERFASLCEDIARTGARNRSDEFAGITDLHSERLAMGTTSALAPGLLRIPLADDRYRCDGPSWPGYELRDPDLVEEKPISAEDRKRAFNTRRISPAMRELMWRQIRKSPVAPFGEAACRPEIWHYVSNPDSPGPQGVNVIVVNQFLWSLYGFSIILGTDWWEELSG